MSENEHAFEIVETDVESGTVTIKIQKGLIGAMAKQLKNTDFQRKGASIIQKLGLELSRVGDILYGSKKRSK